MSILAISGISWLALWFFAESLHGSVHGSVHDHHSGMTHLHSSSAYTPLNLSAMALFVTGWAMMTTAMMLPTTLPLLNVFRAITKEKVNRAILTVLVCAGYTIAWVGFGLLVFFARSLVDSLASGSVWLSSHSWVTTGALLLLAGLFQFSSLKYRCLDKCRSPVSFVISHWHGGRESWEAFRIGFDHGVFCVGCCWALMLLMFAVGTGSLVWMIVLAAVMGIEKNMTWGRKLSTPLGILLVGAGLFSLIQGYSRATLGVSTNELRSQPAQAPAQVSFPTQDGGRVVANLYGSGESGVVLAHGGRFNKESWDVQARELVKAGYRVLAIDFRGYGQSKGPSDSEPMSAPLYFDVLAAVRYLREAGTKRVAVIGGSLGAAAGADAVIEAAPGEMTCLIELGGAGGNLLPERLKGPKLFIVTREDKSGDGLRLPGFQKQYEKVPNPKRMLILEGSAHAQFMFQTELKDRVMRRILQFLADNMKSGVGR